MIHPSIIETVCATQCDTQWCCSTRYFSPPPLRRREIDAIAAAGIRDFFRYRNGTPVLRENADGYCVHFDGNARKCGIHPLRPDDCRMFPFDFFRDPGGRFRWLLWDCPLSRLFDETDIRMSPARLEREFGDSIRETLDYGLEDYSEPVFGTRPRTRMLRPLEIIPRVPKASCRHPFPCSVPPIR